MPGTCHIERDISYFLFKCIKIPFSGNNLKKTLKGVKLNAKSCTSKR